MSLSNRRKHRNNGTKNAEYVVVVVDSWLSQRGKKLHINVVFFYPPTSLHVRVHTCQVQGVGQLNQPTVGGEGLAHRRSRGPGGPAGRAVRRKAVREWYAVRRDRSQALGPEGGGERREEAGGGLVSSNGSTTVCQCDGYLSRVKGLHRLPCPE